MQIHIALLRGINLGGTNRLPMKDLAAFFEKAGCEQVRTWLQSGNVVFQAAMADAPAIVQSVSQDISEQFGLNIPIITRTLEDLEQVAQGNPFPDEKIETKFLHVSFLKDLPEPARLESLAADRSPPDRFQVFGRDIFLYLPNGVARTKLTNQYFDRKLKTISTVRNWNTVLKLLQIGADL